jgi:hypothetical protein
MSDAARPRLSEEQEVILATGAMGPVDLANLLIHLCIGSSGLLGRAPTAGKLDEFFREIEPLVRHHLARPGRVADASLGRLRSRRFDVEEDDQPFEGIQERVRQDCAAAIEPEDWAFSFWLINTEAGDAVARRHWPDGLPPR